jgi:hypothetical protein
MRGTLPWIAPEIVKSPGNVTEAVRHHVVNGVTISLLHVVTMLRIPVAAVTVSACSIKDRLQNTHSNLSFWGLLCELVAKADV